MIYDPLAKRKIVSEQLRVSNLRNDMREINRLTSRLLQQVSDEHKAELRAILRISHEAIYR